VKRFTLPEAMLTKRRPPREVPPGPHSQALARSAARERGASERAIEPRGSYLWGCLWGLGNGESPAGDGGAFLIVTSHLGPIQKLPFDV